MHEHEASPVDVAAHFARRAALARALSQPALLFAGRPVPRNYPANTFAYRASSHFLYFVGAPISGAALLVTPQGRSIVFRPTPPADDALWHGPSPTDRDLAAALGCEVLALESLTSVVAPTSCCTLPAPDAATRRLQSELLGRPVEPGRIEGEDARLADAVIDLRLVHDGCARAELLRAACATREAHRAGMRASRPGVFEWQVRAEMMAALLREGCGVAYEPIVTTHGEVLHNHAHHHPLESGDLLLADVGAETPGGWAGDVTRTWPVSGRFSPTQRAVYDVVLTAQERAIAAVAPGVRYRDVHLAASLALAEGLCELGILRGARPESLVEQGAHALFFPHGVGHLLGLDVHDMEDLGDRAGYAPGRTRSSQFGLSYLRLDRDLAPGMAVTIEPGFYRIPAILESEAFRGLREPYVNVDALEHFADVRGIRIEDDVLVTEEGCEVLTADIPKTPDAVEAWMRGETPGP